MVRLLRAVTAVDLVWCCMWGAIGAAVIMAATVALDTIGILTQ